MAYLSRSFTSSLFKWIKKCSVVLLWIWVFKNDCSCCFRSVTILSPKSTQSERSKGWIHPSGKNVTKGRFFSHVSHSTALKHPKTCVRKLSASWVEFTTKVMLRLNCRATSQDLWATIFKLSEQYFSNLLVLESSLFLLVEVSNYPSVRVTVGC